MADQTVTARFVADISSFQSNLRALQASARELKASAFEMSSALSQSSSGMQTLSQSSQGAISSTKHVGDSARESRQSFLSLAGSASEVVEELGEIVGAVASVVMALGAQRDEMKAFERGFQSLTMSVGEAKKQMDELSKTSAAKAFGQATINEIVLLAGRLGKDTKVATQEVKALADALAGAGGSADKLMPIWKKLQEIKEQAVVTKKDIDELADLGIESWEMLAFASGKTTDTIKREVASGAMSGKEAYHDLLEGATKDLGAAEAASKDFGSSLSRLGQELGEAFGPAIDDLAKLISALADAEQEAHRVSDALKFIFAPGLLITDRLPKPTPPPGYATGITDNPVGHGGWVGEDGPEFMWIPERATIFPNGMSPFENRSSSPVPSLPAFSARMSSGGEIPPITIVAELHVDGKKLAEKTIPHISTMIRNTGRRR